MQVPFIVFGLTLVVSILAITEAFQCYQCSYDKLYNVNQRWNKKECMDNPDSIGTSAHVKCNSTSFCTYQEMYDLNRRAVTSYYRSCTGSSRGNECIQDWTHITCTGTCKGDFCNRNEIGQHHVIHSQQIG